MSVFFCVFNRNGNPVDTKIVEDMLESMSSWDPDESNLRIDGFVALGHGMLWNTPESKYEHLPLKTDSYILIMDARIDNRKELCKELNLPNGTIEEIGDSEFILAAYKKWGKECPKHLLGDFSFVIWDEKKKQLFCARDHVGIKPLFYFQSDETFVISNDISVLLNHTQIPKDLDDITVAYFNKDDGIHSKYDTFFEKIKKVPPASSMTVSSKRICKNCYWNIENAPQIRYKTFDEYVKKLRELFNDAIEVRLRTNYEMASHLSGGIDSSSIAVQAARKLKDRGELLHVYNWIDIPKDKEKYEYESWSFSRRIAEQEENIIHEEFCLDPAYMARQYITHDIFTQGTFYYWGEYSIQERMKETDVRTMLSGWGGDDLITFRGRSFISGLFMQGKIFTALYFIISEKKYSQYFGSSLIKSVLKNILPSKLFLALRRIVKSDIDVKQQYDRNIYMYTTDTFTEFNKLQPDEKFPTAKGARNMQLALYNWGHLNLRTESLFLSGISRRMEYRYPLLDKRIVEFAVGIPEELFYPQKGKERLLYKTAILDLLPSDIVWSYKYAGVKINRTQFEKYEASLKVLKEILYNQKLEYIDDKYYHYDRMFYNIFKNDEKSKMGNVVAPILFLYAKIRLSAGKEKVKRYEKDMEKTNY